MLITIVWFVLHKEVVSPLRVVVNVLGMGVETVEKSIFANTPVFRYTTLGKHFNRVYVYLLLVFLQVLNTILYLCIISYAILNVCG